MTAKYKGYNDLPLTPITTVGSDTNMTGGWRAQKPKFDRANCIRCYICWKFCPDVAIAIGKDEYPVFDYDHCKGCGICAHECPKKCIVMVPEE
jgi:2-oxoisovalerate ferredoxin oxidoreductase delta subunit